MDENQGQEQVVVEEQAAAEQPAAEEAVVEEAPAAVAEQPVAEAHEVEPAPTELKCRECGQVKPVSAFYKVTKDGKYRQPCKDCYDTRYYGRKHGERKVKVVTTDATGTDGSAAAVAAVVETLPEEAGEVTLPPTPPLEPEPIAEDKPKRKGRKNKKADAAETPAPEGGEQASGTDEPTIELPASE